MPIASAQTDEAVDEERRLLYVAITRAEEELWCSWAERGSSETAAAQNSAPARGWTLSSARWPAWPRKRLPRRRPRWPTGWPSSGSGLGAAADQPTKVAEPEQTEDRGDRQMTDLVEQLVKVVGDGPRPGR